MTLLVLSPEMRFSTEEVGALEAIGPVRVVQAANADAFASAVPEADAVVGPMSPALVTGARRLRWVFHPAAGVDWLPLEEMRSAGVTLTNLHGRQGDAMADHALMLLLALSRGLGDCVRQQAEGVWKPVAAREVAGQRLLVAGFGAIGRCIAVRARACGMSVVGLRRRPEPDPIADEVVGPDALIGVLRKVDATACVLPLTRETRGVFGEDAFAAMREGALFVNVGRGKLVDGDALFDGLTSGHLGGAGLDVTPEEPLPKDHPLWRAPRILITPHMAGRQHERRRVVHAALAENLERFLVGAPLKDTVDLAAGY